ncbi:MAG: ribosome maturation factor RimP [Defluviitaleaceae bacterium]|nr:ribosome maturation factor RimP [Defluviitaleaceae bacterium]
MVSVVEKVEKLMLPICEETRTYLIDIDYEQENGTWYLRIFVDTADGLTMDDCVAVTELISVKLDELDVISEEYMLEVSSPGAERPLKTVEAIAEAVGSYVNVVVHHEINEIDEFQGDLISFESDILVLECLFKTRKKRIEIAYSNVKKARLAVKF